MALLFLDSFDHLATSDLLEKWTSVWAGGTVAPTIAATGRTANALQWTAASGIPIAMQSLTLTPQGGASGATAIVGFAFKISSLSGLDNGAYGAAVTIFDGSTAKFGYRVNTDGTWSCGTGDGPSTYTSSGVPIQNGTWAYVEFKTVLHDTTGSAEIRVNGTTVLSETNIDTVKNGTASWSSITLFSTGYTQSGAPNVLTTTIDIDDFYLLDGTEGDADQPNNDFWGDTSIKYLAPEDDQSVAFDGSDGNQVDNFDLVNDATPDDDTTYVTTDVVDATDLYEFPSIATGATVYGVQAVLSAKKGEAGSAQVAAVFKPSGGSVYEHGSPLGVASDSAYAYFLFPWDVSPATGVAWTESELNGAAFGPRKTA